ncbi:hypothetical protein, partial [Marinobacter halodurans]|uniref:hypothetical protein n=1 Tax=Marinobacter halodurans TaxID=2528979 RepID=UPI001A955786
LGYDGVNVLIEPKNKKNFDPFIYEMYLSQKLIPVDQTDWLFSHSGMHIPSEEVFEKSYRDTIMRYITIDGGHFGSY